MTRNPFDDNTAYFAGAPNAMVNAHGREFVLSGVVASKGTGDWDVDVTSGSVYVDGTFASVSAGSPAVQLTDPASDADMDAGESRVDLITADSSGTIAAVEGTAATDPVTPDIPSDEVAIAGWLIAEGDSTLADSDKLDWRVIGGVVAQTPTNVTGSRSEGTWYQNTQGVPLVVYVSEEHSTTDNNITGHINTSQSDNRVIYARDTEADGGNTAIGNAITMIVPTNHYYKVEIGGNSAPDEWHEHELV